MKYMLEKYLQPLNPYIYQPNRYYYIIIPYDPRSYISGVGETIFGYIKDDNIYETLITNTNQLNNQSIKMVIGQNSQLIPELTYLSIVDCEFRNGSVVMDIHWLKNKFPDYFENNWEKIKNNYENIKL